MIEGVTTTEEGGEMQATRQATVETIGRWTVRNVYGIAGTSTHRTPEAAIRAARRREGCGWIVEGHDGRRWTDCGGHAVEV